MSAIHKLAPHYTVSDYALWKGDWELWEGIAIAMTPSPFGRHQLIVTELVCLIRNALHETECDAVPFVELDWVISHDTVVRPDIMVICGPPPERHLENVPALVAEVLSDTTRLNDVGYKRQRYQREGVSVYLIVDPVSQTIQIDRRQPNGSYITETSGSDLTMRLCEDCEIRFSTQSIFRR
ncbi:MAG: Uma2 family endonuclease [Pirellulaceae bacterium]|nr:Uma2 family endonuclease [Pirellulaceae bacterium]